MRKAVSTLLVVGIAVATLATQASAGVSNLTVRRDPDDAPVLDIRAVATAPGRQIYTGVRTWDQFSSGDVILQNGSGFQFRLDTRGRGAADYFVNLGWDNNQGRFECDVYNRGGGFKGDRQAFIPNTSDGIACFTPRKWYDFTKTVKFGVQSYDNNVFQDRAPNRGRYVGL
jgi:hypothetical protein